MIDFEFLIDPDGSLHIEKHAVSPSDVDEAINDRPYIALKRDDGSYVAFSQLANGRILQLAFRKRTKTKFFIITAFDVEDPAVRDYVVRELE